MNQLHINFTDDQVKVLFAGYYKGQLSRAEVQDVLKIGKSQFFKLLKTYRQDPDGFTVAYQRKSPGRLSAEDERWEGEQLGYRFQGWESEGRHGSLGPVTGTSAATDGSTCGVTRNGGGRPHIFA